MGKIDIKGDIVSNDVGEFYEWFGMSSTYPQKIQQAILNDEDNEIVLDVASNGGDVFAASEIYTMLRDSQKNIVVNIQGLAASAASVIAMAGNTVRMSPTSQLMIHKASVSTVGNSYDLEHEIMFNESDDEPIFENAIHALPSKAAINKFKNLIAKEKLNKQSSQSTNSVRERKLAILLDEKGEN